MSGKSITSISDLSKEEIDYLIKNSIKIYNKIKERGVKGIKKVLMDYCLMMIFLENSTRTRLSFERAMKMLGGTVVDLGHIERSSMAKGENLRDTIYTIKEMFIDVIVFRHYITDSAKSIQKWAHPVPVINAGDGQNEHPTQALTDLLTIKFFKKTLDYLNIAIIGDLKTHRVAHSLVQALGYYNNVLYLISPPNLNMPKKYIKKVKSAKLVEIQTIKYEKIKNIIKDIDVIYISPLKPYMDEYYTALNAYDIPPKETFYVTSKWLSLLKDDSIILHPLPRHGEISENIDSLPQAKYFDQVKLGLYMKMAILMYVLLNNIDFN